MKKQMKSSLFAAAVGLSLLGAITISATSEDTEPAAHQQKRETAAPVGSEPSKVPFAFYLTLVTTFTNGGSIDFDLVSEEEEESAIWNEMPKWSREQ